MCFALYRQAVLISRALAIQFRGAKFREAVRGESAEEVHQIVNLTRGKPQRLHLGVEERIVFPAFVEEVDNVPQSLEASVVHVWPRKKDVAQKRGLKAPISSLFRVTRKRPSSE